MLEGGHIKKALRTPTGNRLFSKSFFLKKTNLSFLLFCLVPLLSLWFLPCGHCCHCCCGLGPGGPLPSNFPWSQLGLPALIGIPSCIHCIHCIRIVQASKDTLRHFDMLCLVKVSDFRGEVYHLTGCNLCNRKHRVIKILQTARISCTTCLATMFPRPGFQQTGYLGMAYDMDS